MGAVRDQARLTLSQSVAAESAVKRDLIFETDVSNLLNDDVVFTSNEVDTKARQLLTGLKDFRHSDVQVGKSI